MKFYPLKIADIRRETADCVSVAFEITEPLLPVFQFTQGQYLTLKKGLPQGEFRRSYSLCSSPREHSWRVAIKKVEGGVFSTFCNDQLKKGDVLEVAPPEGRFFPANLPLQPFGHGVFFAAGSGITPIISIVKTVLLESPENRVTLIYGNKNAGSVIFREEIEGLKNRYLGRFQVIYILSKERIDTDWQQGRINEEKMGRIFEKMPELASANQFFVCGPEEMALAVREFLQKSGIPSSKVHFELFGVTRKAASSSATPSSTVIAVAELRLDGVQYEVPIHEGQALLDAALAIGADLPFACKGGVCCTCRAKLLEGTVEMEANYSLDPDEVEAGFILTCQSHPKTPVLKVDFDIK